MDSTVVHEFTSIFHAVDTNHDAQVSKDELLSAMRAGLLLQSYGSGGDEDALSSAAEDLTQQYLQKLDVGVMLNQDGSVSLDEWLAFWTATSEHFPETCDRWHIQEIRRYCGLSATEPSLLEVFTEANAPLRRKTSLGRLGSVGSDDLIPIDCPVAEPSGLPPDKNGICVAEALSLSVAWEDLGPLKAEARKLKWNKSSWGRSVREASPAAISNCEDARPTPHDWKYLWDWKRNLAIAADPVELTLPEGLCTESPPDTDSVSQFLSEVTELLSDRNYVEDPDGDLGFSYTAEFLEWVFHGPRCIPELLIGIRDSATKRLVAFHGSYPITVVVDGKTSESALIDMVCVHKDWRGNRLCPYLYQLSNERRAAAAIPTAVKTSGDVLFTSVVEAQYHHRKMPGSIPKLLGCGFTCIPRDMTLKRLIKLNQIDRAAERLLSPLTPALVESCMQLLNSNCSSFRLSAFYNSAEEFGYTFLPRHNIVQTLISVGEAGAVDTMLSFYFVNTVILTGEYKGQFLKTAYVFYCAAREPSVLPAMLQESLAHLEELGVDVVNALPVMHFTSEHLQTLRFGAGTGILRYYCCNMPVQTIQKESIAIFPGL